MLEKGFLKTREEKKDNTTAKTKALLLIAGIIFVLGGMYHIFSRIEQYHETVNIGMAGIIIGFVLIIISFWMNFFARNKMGFFLALMHSFHFPLLLT